MGVGAAVTDGDERAAADGGLRIRQVAHVRGELRGSRLHPRRELRRCSRPRSARSPSLSVGPRSPSRSWWMRRPATASRTTSPPTAGRSRRTYRCPADTSGSSQNRRPRPDRSRRRRTARGCRTARGVATFQWKPTDPTATSTVTMIEQVKPGYIFVDYVMRKERAGQDHEGSPASARLRGRLQGDLGPNEYAKCTVRNRRAPPRTPQSGSSRTRSRTATRCSTSPASLGEFELSDDDEPNPSNLPGLHRAARHL